MNEKRLHKIDIQRANNNEVSDDDLEVVDDFTGEAGPD
jgi:hypothetical protein